MEKHYLQNYIIRELQFSVKLSYTELKNILKIENNKLNFHLKELVKQDIITKTPDNQYSLTQVGKSYSSNLISEKLKLSLQAKLSVWMICTKKNGKNELEYLFYRRLKHPFYGCEGFPSGKIDKGETVISAAKRELKEETHLQASLVVPKALIHYLVKDTDNNLLEDKFMFLVHVKDTEGKLISSNEGQFFWVKESEISNKIKKPFEDLESIYMNIELIKSEDKSIKFHEFEHVTSKF